MVEEGKGEGFQAGVLGGCQAEGKKSLRVMSGGGKFKIDLSHSFFASRSWGRAFLAILVLPVQSDFMEDVSAVVLRVDLIQCDEELGQ